jgi:3-isopropylmalate/(R)-2-methylmalate dehydratase small subunit
MSKIKGKVWKYGDDINTDVIFPGKYTYTVSDPAEMARHAMEDLDPDFAAQVQKGDVVVAGTNFGCGSSREQAASCLVAAGVGAVIAKSFSRIFFRNAINWGLPALQCPAAVDALEAGQEVTVDLENGRILAGGQSWKFPELPPEVQGILTSGGLIPYLKAKYQKKA